MSEVERLMVCAPGSEVLDLLYGTSALITTLGKVEGPIAGGVSVDVASLLVG